jgi:hypothetical protein
MQVLNFTGPVIVGPQQTATPLVLLFHPNATQIHLTTTLTLHTNASTFIIPIIVYNGLIKVHNPGIFFFISYRSETSSLAFKKYFFNF